MSDVLALQVLESEATEESGPAFCSSFSIVCTGTTN